MWQCVCKSENSSEVGRESSKVLEEVECLFMGEKTPVCLGCKSPVYCTKAQASFKVTVLLSEKETYISNARCSSSMLEVSILEVIWEVEDMKQPLIFYFGKADFVQCLLLAKEFGAWKHGIVNKIAVEKLEGK